MHHRDERLPGGEPTKMNENYVVDKEDYLTRMQILMKKTNEQVNERLEKERELMKRRYDNQNKNKKVDEPRVGDRVYVRKEIRGELIPKRMVDADDPLHWSWVCGQCGTRALGTVWKSAPETLHEIPISCVLDVILIASVIRKEGETASRLLVEDVLERRELQGVTEEDVKQGLLRACQHINHCKVEGKTMVFSFGEDIPRRFHSIYADLLGEEKEANRVFGGFLSFVSLEEVLGKGRKEYRSEYFQWKEVCTETIEEEARELRKKGAKILIVWPGRNASYKELEGLMEKLKLASEARCRVVLIPPPLNMSSEWEKDVPLIERWVSLNATSAQNVKIMIDSGRYNSRCLNMDLFHVAMKGGRDEYERLATAIYSGAKWKIEKRKEKLECYRCGGEHYRRECPLNTAKGRVMDKNEMERKMDGKEMERKMDGKEERMDRRKNERGTWESNDRKRRSDGFEWGGKRERSTNEGEPVTVHNHVATRSNPCNLCDKINHTAKHCKKYIHVCDKYNRVLEKKLCVRCFGKHNAEDCSSAKSCSKCGKDHHPIFCFILSDSLSPWTLSI
ncbi:hypothetical protein PRIPAC_91368 [Pristionchus pacificus]|uniref:Uncharacterized protein n=1 Tax=Pristionchus pacificus TaxID=54126 RepID=A0A2A6B6N7_PRIPA|nr:hypothetical protein PRIPAC_91368 [Pristionchus pacificus]|eukprot:PDM61537.1 hypothetical protein PRIPAC_50979 [Pristionchus pacificus]